MTISNESDMGSEMQAYILAMADISSRDGPAQSTCSNNSIHISLDIDNLRRQAKKVCCPVQTCSVLALVKSLHAA